MRRTTLLIVSVLLAVPALAHAKAGVEFEQDPELAPVGTSIAFTVMAFREPGGPSGPSSGEPHPVVGAHPLLTFRSHSGKVIRVRAGRTNSEGIGHGAVTFTDAGPWVTEMHIPGVFIGQESTQPINAGVGLTQTTPPSAPAAQHSASQADDGFPWVWILSGASILAALLVAGMRRRGHWRTA